MINLKCALNRFNLSIYYLFDCNFVLFVVVLYFISVKYIAGIVVNLTLITL